LNSENYLKSFVVKINQEFNKSLPTINASQQNVSEHTDDDGDIEQLLFDEQQFQSEPATSSSESYPPPAPPSIPETKYQPKMFKQLTEKPADKIVARKIEKPKQNLVKIEKISEQKSSVVSESDDHHKEYMEMDSSAMYNEDEEQLDDDGNIFGEEIYDIMEIDHEPTVEENVYLDDSGKQILADDESEFILVNFKSSNEDLTDKDQFVVEELYDEDIKPDLKPTTTRKKHVNRMPREIIEKYAQSTENNQHICTKCVKVFSTRTNLIRHIQSHDGYKAYVCTICNKGFTQSGSLKQHLYIHSGERPYKCHFCDRAFTQGKTLKFHLRRHTEEKPFICTECSSAFRQRDGLKRHLKSRHNIELVYERNNQLDEKMLTFAETDQEKKEEDSTNIETIAEESEEQQSI
jgi:Zinc finger, C2H2 type